MALYTGKGDDGTTKLFDSGKGERVSKSSAIAEALGTVDELNTFLGLCKSEARVLRASLTLGKKQHLLEEVVHEMQDNLFTIQAELAGADKKIRKAHVTKLEKLIHAIDDVLPPITTFSVPGATELSARFDVARTVTRRAERRMKHVDETGERKLGKETLRFINRLSSALFALARYVNHIGGKEESKPSYT